MLKEKRIIIFYHIKERELAICEIIEDAINKVYRNSNIIIGKFENDYKKVFDFRPDIIITLPPRVDNTTGILTLLKSTVDPIIISMTTEGLHELDSNTVKSVVGYNEYSAQLIDYYIFWGPKTAEALGKVLLSEQKALSEEQLKTFGYVMFEKEVILNKFKESKINHELRKECKNYSKIVTCVTGFQGADETIEDYKIMGIFKFDIESLHKKEIIEAKKRINSSIEYREKYIEQIKRCALSCQNILFIVKMHPVEINELNIKNTYHTLRDVKNIFIIEENIPLGIVLNYTDMFVHYGSTTGLEAYIYQKPTIQFVSSPEKYPNTNYGRAFYPSTKLIDIDNKYEFEDIISKGIEFKEMKEINSFLYDRFNFDFNSKYSPSIEIAQFLCSDLKRNEISKIDPKVQKLMGSRFVFGCRLELYRQFIKFVLKFKLGQAYKYYQYLKLSSNRKFFVLFDTIRWIGKLCE